MDVLLQSRDVLKGTLDIGGVGGARLTKEPLTAGIPPGLLQRLAKFS